jgi:hypothetical protein
MLHAALRFGGSRVYAARSMSDLLACCCRQPQCWPQQQQQQQQVPGQPQVQGQQQREQQQEQYQLESLTHLFVSCPTIRGAWDWFAAVWEQMQPASGLDCSTFRTLLLDDSSVWQPPAALHQLWTHLRLLMLECIWEVRCAAEGRTYSSGQVVARFRVVLQQHLRRDWVRTQGDIRVDSGVPMSWLRGRSPVLQPERFVAKWQAVGRLYTVSAAGELRVRLPHFG